MPDTTSEIVKLPELPSGIILPCKSDIKCNGPLNREWFTVDANGNKIADLILPSLINAVYLPNGLRDQLQLATKLLEELVEAGDAIVKHDTTNHITQDEDHCSSCDVVYPKWRARATKAAALVRRYKGGETE